MTNEEITNNKNIWFYLGCFLIMLCAFFIGFAANRYFYTDEKDWRLVQAKTFLNGPACDTLVMDNTTVTCYPNSMSQFISTSWCSTNHTKNQMIISGCINNNKTMYRIGQNLS